jgi:hypothetical protein
MKTLFISLLFIPLYMLGQAQDTYTVFENGILTANPAMITEFEAGLASHNQKFHAEGLYGARVYWISNGPNVGRYVWVMGPLPWSALDQRPAQEGHDTDWNTTVLPYMMVEGDQDYWRFHPELSNFPADFDLKNLLVFMVDIKRFQDMAFIDKVVKKVQKVYMEQYPEQTYGVYTNEMASASGKDFAWVDFFSETSWLGRPDTFPQKFEAVHGAGSFAGFLQDVETTTNGEVEEYWIFREDLSGLKARVAAVARQ